MPTGYTADITDTTSFPEFAMRCARAFGALITMRDDPLDAPIKPLEVSDYHLKAMERSRDQLAGLQLLSAEELQAAADREYDKNQLDAAEAIANKRATEANYRRMLAFVADWTPPTPDHEELKAFMVQQIEDSIKWDCDTEFFERSQPKISGAQWKENRAASLSEDIEYHERHHLEEIERTKQRNKWVEDLRNSLTQEHTPCR